MLVALACVAMMGGGAAAQDSNPVVRPTMIAPGTNAVIEAGEPSGWSNPEDMQATTGTAAIPAATRQLWTEEARRMQRLGTTTTLKASRSGGVLMLALNGGRTLKLFDQGVPGSALYDGDRFHLLVDLPLAANLYAVDVMMNEFDFHWLILPSTGVMTSLPGKPVLSADLRRAFGFRDELMNGRELAVVSIGPDQVTHDEVSWQPDNEPDTEYALSWTADGQAITVSEVRQKTHRTSFRLLLKDGAWRRE
ncbi:MAG: hypothetical protein KF889_08595 [Alphaproteobacteria bacterium]|nr:hypothetical protein [Alphaproteobacteria bacterium]MCW5740879.1 hypothetical protein [Alphaproteobacteria bacterium]